MDEYKSNSHKSRQDNERKKATKVVTGVAKTKKKTGLQKFAGEMISEDLSNVKNYIFMDVIIPSIKKAISDVIKTGVDMILYNGESSPSASTNSRTSYRSYYESNNVKARSSSNTKTKYDYDEIIFSSRGDAEAVLDELDELISQYGAASIMDLYSAADLECDYTYNKYGWTNIRNAQVIRGRDGGYMIKLPKPLPL